MTFICFMCYVRESSSIWLFATTCTSCSYKADTVFQYLWNYKFVHRTNRFGNSPKHVRSIRPHDGGVKNTETCGETTILFLFLLKYFNQLYVIILINTVH